MNEFSINKEKVGKLSSLVIAEIGINHGGSLSVAKEMVDVAARLGVEIIKHQTHIVEDEMSAHAKDVIPGNSKNLSMRLWTVVLYLKLRNMTLRNTLNQKYNFISTPFQEKQL